MLRVLFAIVIVPLVACGKDKAEPIMIDDAAAAAKKDIAQIKEALAAKKTTHASTVCSVAKPGLATLKRADAALADELAKLCMRDQPMMEMTIALEKIEANKKPDPTGLERKVDCASRSVYEKWIAKGGYQADPEVVALEARWETACPTQKP